MGGRGERADASGEPGGEHGAQHAADDVQSEAHHPGDDAHAQAHGQAEQGEQGVRVDDSRPGSRRVRAASRALDGCRAAVATRVGRHAYRHVHRGLKVVVVRVEELPTVIEILVPGDRREGRHLLVLRHVRHRARSTRACLARERRRWRETPETGRASARRTVPDAAKVPFHYPRRTRATFLFTGGRGPPVI